MVFFCKYQERSLLANLHYEKLDLLMGQYKNKVVEPKYNKRNKGLVVKSISDYSDKVFFSIMDTVRHYETRGMKLDRKSISRNFVKCGVYKRLSFQFEIDYTCIW